MKRFISFILCCIMAVSLCIPAFAVETETGGNDALEVASTHSATDVGDAEVKSVMVPQTTYSWRFTTKSSGTATAGSWTLFYEGEPSKNGGETDTASAGVSYTHTFSGSLTGEVKEKVQVQLGYSFGKSAEFSVSKQSRTLKKGEYVKAYYMKNYELTTVNQTQYKTVRGWQQKYPGGPYEFVNTTSATGKTQTATAKRAILPKIKLEYYMSRSTRSANILGVDEIPYETEIYEYIDGQYVLTERIPVYR